MKRSGSRESLLFPACRVWQITWVVEVPTTGAGIDQPLAEGKGVHREGNPKEAVGKIPF
jgi:hypothetical protein